MAEITTPTVAAIYEWWRQRGTAEKARRYLGASSIGDACSRKLWYRFRWALQENHPGRLYRLFNRGHREEPVFVEELRGIGATVWEFGEDGQQFGVSFCSGHFRGHCDGVAQGLPEAPKTPHLLEFKTHSNKSFNDLRNNGVQKSKPVHYDQMQVYMHGLELSRALYLAVNKDTDELYSERLEYSQSHALAIIARAESIIAANEPPPRCSDNPAYYLCKMCEFAPICHGQQMPCVNCRTCTHSTPDMKNDDGRWVCALAEQDIPDDVQYIGCDMHLYIPAFLQARNASVADASPEENWIEYVLENGKSFRNGPRDDDRRPESGMFDSWEIRAACADGDLSLLTDAELNQIREKFSARVGETECS